MNIKQRFARYIYPQVLVILACGILFSLLVFWFALQKITQNNFLPEGNSVAQDRAQQLGFKAYFQPSTPIWDFFGILPAAASTGKNCTYSVHYLSKHPELWNTSNNISTSRYSFTKNDLLSLFQTQTQDIPLLLQQQFFAAAVNILNGADPGAIEASMRDASGWIDAHPPRIDLPEADSQKGLQLTQQLQDYDNGNTGPGLCPGQSEPLAASANSAPTSLPASKPATTIPQAAGSATNAVTAPQAAQDLPSVHQPRLTRKNSNSGGQPGETAASGPTQVIESPQQPPANSAASNPAPVTQIQPAPDNPPSPSPGQVTGQAKGQRHSSGRQPAAGNPAPAPPPGQGDPPPPQQAAGGGGSNNGNNQGNGNSGSSGQGDNGNNGGNQGNHYGNGQGNGNSGNYGNGNNGNHGGGGHGKGH